MEEAAKSKQGATRDRWSYALRDEAFESIRDLPLLETRPEHLLRVMKDGTVSTNVFLQRLVRRLRKRAAGVEVFADGGVVPIGKVGDEIEEGGAEGKQVGGWESG